MMSKKQIKIGFEGFIPSFKYESFLPFQILKEHFDVVVSDKPDYLFCTIYNKYKYCDSDCIRIFWTAECYSPDFNLFDYAICLDDFQFQDRVLGVPYFFYTEGIEKLRNKELFTKENVANRKKFCNFIYSHEGIPERTDIFNTIAKYRMVDSAGKYLNNMEGFTPGNRDTILQGFNNDVKLDFQRLYKFSIACENYVFPNYVTEKILHAFMANTIPIYYGDPLVTKHFNPKAFINCSDYESLDKCLEFIMSLDKDDDRYLEMLNQPLFNNPNIVELYKGEMESFLLNIFKQNYRSASRRPKTIYTEKLNRDLSRYTKIHLQLAKILDNKMSLAIRRLFA